MTYRTAIRDQIVQYSRYAFEEREDCVFIRYYTEPHRDLLHPNMAVVMLGNIPWNVSINDIYKKGIDNV